MKKKKKNKIVVVLISILIISLLIGGFLLLFRNITVDSNLYCSENTCYTYDGTVLREYEKKDSKKTGYVHKSTCFNCTSAILKHTDNVLLIRKDNIVYHYYKKNYVSKTMNPQSLVGLAFKSKLNEIYFFDSSTIIISDEKGMQKKYSYQLETYGDEYYSILVFDKIAYTYNVKEKEVLGYKRVQKDSLEFISLEYYNEDGTIKEKDKYKISGIFKMQRGYQKEELWIYKNKVLYGTVQGVSRGELKVLDANEKEIYFGLNSDTIEYYYNIEEKVLYTYEKFIAFSNVDKKDLVYIKTDYYQEDTSLKTISLNIDGAYQYKEENVEKEILIKNGEITLVEYYTRSPDLTKKRTVKYKADTRTENKITYVYITEGNIKEEFSYDLKNKKIIVYYDEYKKVKESDLKHIK